MLSYQISVEIILYRNLHIKILNSQLKRCSQQYRPTNNFSNKQGQMYYRSGTGGTFLHSLRANASYALTGWQHFPTWNDVTAAVLKVWRQIENPTPSIAADLFKEQSCQISPRTDLKHRSLGLFLKQGRTCNNSNKMSSDMTSVPDLKISTVALFSHITATVLQFICIEISQ